MSHNQTSGQLPEAKSTRRALYVFNNVGSIKTFLSTPLPALRGARHFALVENSPSSAQARVYLSGGPIKRYVERNRCGVGDSCGSETSETIRTTLAFPAFPRSFRASTY